MDKTKVEYRVFSFLQILILGFDLDIHILQILSNKLDKYNKLFLNHIFSFYFFEKALS